MSQILSDIILSYQKNRWIRERAILRNRNIQLQKVSRSVEGKTRCEWPGFLRAEKVERFEEIKLLHTAEQWNSAKKPLQWLTIR